MGHCVSSDRTEWDARKAVFAGQDFSAVQGMEWSGLAAMCPDGGELNVAQVNARSGEVRAGSGDAILKVSRLRCSTMFTDPSSGAVVALVHLVERGNIFTHKNTTWSMWADTPSKPDQQPETAPNDMEMYRWGTCTNAVPNRGVIECDDANGERVLTATLSDNGSAIVMGPDGTLPAAVVEGIHNTSPQGRVTFAPGVDPALAFAVSFTIACMAG
mmetsp:Transcript_77350/g.205309  ORF Transcript_77350/g.205309 Transcript_77350/m.205309 type:complete len:215 (-) Transcript_77350:165-809(-)